MRGIILILLCFIIFVHSAENIVQVYVDSLQGVNNGTCENVTQPCKTLSYSVNDRDPPKPTIYAAYIQGDIRALQPRPWTKLNFTSTRFLNMMGTTSFTSLTCYDCHFQPKFDMTLKSSQLINCTIRIDNAKLTLSSQTVFRDGFLSNGSFIEVGQNGLLSLSGPLFIDNIANSSAIITTIDESAKIDISAANFTQNTAALGIIYSNSNDNGLVWTNLMMHKNRVTLHAPIYRSIGVLSVTNSQFSENVGVTGGVIMMEDVTGLSLGSVYFRENSADQGGVIYTMPNRNESAAMNGYTSVLCKDIVRFERNKARQGGVIYNAFETHWSLWLDTPMTKEGPYFVNNTATEGGTFYTTDIIKTINLPLIVYNSHAERGGGAYITATGGITNTTFISSSATLGGAIYRIQNLTSPIVSMIWAVYSSAREGGAIYTEDNNWSFGWNYTKISNTRSGSEISGSGYTQCFAAYPLGGCEMCPLSLCIDNLHVGIPSRCIVSNSSSCGEKETCVFINRGEPACTCEATATSCYDWQSTTMPDDRSFLMQNQITVPMIVLGLVIGTGTMVFITLALKLLQRWREQSDYAYRQ
ncbi:polymorphic membrane protein [Planoprotostelium fungivorum]|uniref:Polymorphic membrane protein n=1 Tax=Planoprotostelium fungivorum TaxID=1890364 RepID=A0A2P6NLW7_9EUKA|nr:polymorphic membrane protein [Planoprotostelium fungivorum]